MITEQGTEQKEYSVTVGNGTATPNTAAEGTKVTIKADEAEEGMVFDKWIVESGKVVLEDPESAETTFVMGISDVVVNAVYKEISVYEIIEGENLSVIAGAPAVFISNAEFSKFKEVRVDGTILENDHYDAENCDVKEKTGLTKVTLKESYIESLSLGSHTIEIVSEDGSASTKFTVSKLEEAVITLLPKEAEVKQGDTLQFTAEITGIDDKSVIWNIEGAKSENTNISEWGLLSVGEDETAKELLVKVVAKEDTFMVGTHQSAEAEKKVIDEFNKKYEGKIKVNIEELPSDSAYVDKMKTLAASNALPDVVIGKEGIRELAVKNGQAVDLIPLLEEDAEWKEEVGEGAIEYNKDGDALYSIANQKQIIGYFYNKAMFEDAGIKPAETWDEFMSNNEKLKEAGYTPLALMTGENCWTTNLWLAAMIGTDGEAGNEFMNTFHPESYENDSVVKALGMIQECLAEYTTSDAVGALAANAMNNFEQGKTAMIANGPWMTPDFEDPEKTLPELKDQIGIAAYPESGLIEQYEVGYVLCTNEDDEKVQEAALEFLKFKTGKEAQTIFLEDAGALPLTDQVQMSDKFIKENPLVAELVEMGNSNKSDFNNIDNTAVASTIEAFSAYYPDLAAGNMTPEEMAKKLTEAAAKTK